MAFPKNIVRKGLIAIFFSLLAGSVYGESAEKAAKQLWRDLEVVTQDHNVIGLATCAVMPDGSNKIGTWGKTRYVKGPKVNPDTRFRIASLSKGFAATLAAKLVDDGALSWEDPVAPHSKFFELKDSRQTQQVTLEYALSHRLGLPHYAFDRLLEANWSVSAISGRFAQVDMTCPVGKCYGYQNVGFNLVVPLIESAAQDEYEKLVEEKIFQPLNMTRANFGKPGLESDDNWARPHVGVGKRQKETTVKPTYYRVPAAAGVNASITDMCRWLEAQLGHHPEALDATTLNTLRTPRVDTLRERVRGGWRQARLSDAEYGLGWRIYDYQGTEVIYHAGSVQGYGAHIIIVPERQTGVVALWNSQASRLWRLAPVYLDTLLDVRSSSDWMKLKSLKRRATSAVAGS